MSLTRKRTRISALFVVVSLIWLAIPLRAQGPTVSRVQIQSINTSEFPTVRIGVSVADAQGGRVPDLDASDWIVREKGAPMQVTLDQESVGLQVVFVIDASLTMKGKGASGQPLIDEAKAAVADFANEQMEDQAQDWVMLLAPKGSQGEVQVISDWTPFRQEVLNQLTLYNLPEDVGATPLFNSVWEAIERLEASPERSHMHRAVVVFSDGVDTVSYITQDNVTDKAEEAGLSIHSVLLSTDAEQAAKNLKNIADVTGGQFAHYAGPASVAPIFEAIASQREQTILKYTSSNTESGTRELEVGVRAGSSGAIAAKDQRTFSVNVQPPQVSVDLPSGSQIRREGSSPQAKTADTEPRAWPVGFQVAWPDDHPREIAEVACVVDGVAKPPVPVPPDYRVQCDITSLEDGDHALAVRVTDALGLRGESAVVAVRVQVILPTPVPTATPIPTATPVPPAPEPTPMPTKWQAFMDNYGTLTALLLAFGALILVIFVLMRRPRVAEMVTSGVSNIASRVREATEPFFPNRALREALPQSKAYLIVLKGDTTRTGNIELVGENMRLGRDAALSTVVFPDRSVSRLHARISEREDGLFFIYDEGSTSGTYVNNETVSAAGHLLQADDTIHLGRVQLQFKLRRAPDAPRYEQDDDKTEPMIPIGAFSQLDQDPEVTDFQDPPEFDGEPVDGAPGDQKPT